MAEDMVIFTRTFDLLEWLLPKSERFPRAYRFTATQRLMDAALDLQEALVEAQARGRAARGCPPCAAPMPLSVGYGFICASPTAGAG